MEADTANPWASLFPLARNWRVLLVCYLLWVAVLIYSYQTAHRLGNIWFWASLLSGPFTHITAFAGLAPLPWTLSRRLPSPWRFAVGFVVSVVSCESVSYLLPIFDGWLLSRAGHQFNLARATAVYSSFVGPAMMIVGGLVASRARSEELRAASEAEAQIAKNRLLQGQVHPHVLFNALNGLAELVHKDPKAAETAIRHLSDLLRRILRASEHMRLPLGEERKIISDFLALEAIRLGPRLRVLWDWDEGLDSIEIPPLLLQPLVENAIKHGIAPSIPGGDIIIRARSRDGSVRLEIWNSGRPFPNQVNGSGIGLKNLRSRLALHFGSSAELVIGPSGQGTLACIQFEATQVEWPHEASEGPGS